MSSGPLKAWIFLIVMSVALMMAGYTFGDRQGLLVGVGLALGINSLVFFYGDLRTLSLFRGRRMEGQDPWGLLPLVKKLASQIKIPTPDVYVVEHPTPQTFSIGRGWKDAKFCVTRGLLDILSPQELEVIIAVELTRIRRLDIFSFQVASALSDGILIVCNFFDRLIALVIGSFYNPRRPHFFQRLFSPVAALVVRLIVGPQNYLLADRQAAEWLRNAKSLALVLWKIESYAATQPLPTPPSMAHLFIVNPLTGSPHDQYFCVHPSLKQRIEYLLGYYPL
jgi:heat shock protein HtpX